MGLPSFVRRVLGAGHFPRLKSQELLDPLAKKEQSKIAVDNLSSRNKALGHIPVLKKPKS